MNRRGFLAASGAIGLGMPAASLAGSTAPFREDQQILEWIKYTLHVGSRKGLVQDFYRDVAIPALNRAGIGPVGVFSVQYGGNDPTLYALLAHENMESVATKTSALMDDTAFMQDGAEFLETPLSNSAYVRSESSLMRAFTHLPKVMPPTHLMENASRIYELRIYESHSIIKAAKKIHMFNEGGEIEVFKKTDLWPVFFGETLVGPLMPNLTYLLAHENMATRDANWDRFRVHPDWIALRENPVYAETVSNITDIIMTPAPFSQV